MGLLTISVSGLTACASHAPGEDADTTEIRDPLSGINRFTFAFNEAVDTVILRPVAEIYRFGVPEPGRNGIRNALRNLRGPVIFINQILQGEVDKAGDTLARFVLNSTVGILGLIDVGAEAGLPYRHADLGQTFAKWGVPSGPYLVLPLIGPSNLRDTAGLVGEFYGDPVALALRSDGETGVRNPDTILVARAAIQAVDTRSRLLRAVDDLRRNSLDYYATVRSAYTQRRAAEINGSSTMTIPAYGNR